MTDNLFPDGYERVIFDDDGISSAVNELGLREEKKAAHSRALEENPEDASFDPDHVTFHNLDNMRSLMKRYPDRYAKEMSDSLKKPEGAKGNYWIGSTFAAQVFKGFSDNDYIESVKIHFEEDRLGIPNEFFQLDEGREWAESLINRSWANRPVNEWLREQLGLEKPTAKIDQTHISNQAGFS